MKACQEGVVAQSTFEILTFYDQQHPFARQVDELHKQGFGEYDEDHRNRYCSVAFASLVAVKAGDAIGLVNLFLRPIVFEGKTMLLGGFGDVTTAAEYRNMHVATTLLNLGKDILTQQGCSFAYLCVGKPEVASLYESIGFVHLGKPHTYLGRDGSRYLNDNGMVMALTSEEDLRLVMNGAAPLDIGVGNW
jgi:predicted N-acetyltransferase YhbS